MTQPMDRNRSSSLIHLAPLTFAMLVAGSSAAQAQTPGPLPTAPGADRAVMGGLSQAHASLPGGPGLSPLEPYLVTWLLPVSGVLTVLAGIYVDGRVRALGRRKAG
jgi:hypothetical protein